MLFFLWQKNGWFSFENNKFPKIKYQILIESEVKNKK